MSDVVETNRRAVEVSVAVVRCVDPARLAVRTPCAEWDLHDLLAHMTAQHHGFAAAAEGRGGELDAWRVRPVGDDPAGEYAAAAERVLGAFGGDGVVDRSFRLPEIGQGVDLPGATAVGFHLVDYVVHGWDVAAAIGVRVEFPDDVLSAALAVAERVPDGAARRSPGASFRPAVPTDAGAPALDRVLALLGRSPAWPS